MTFQRKEEPMSIAASTAAQRGTQRGAELATVRP